MIFRYYIVDTMNGTVMGSNDEEEAIALSESEDYFVIDGLRGEWVADGTGQDIKESRINKADYEGEEDEL